MKWRELCSESNLFSTSSLNFHSAVVHAIWYFKVFFIFFFCNSGMVSDCQNCYMRTVLSTSSIHSINIDFDWNVANDLILINQILLVIRTFTHSQSMSLKNEIFDANIFRSGKMSIWLLRDDVKWWNKEWKKRSDNHLYYWMKCDRTQYCQFKYCIFQWTDIFFLDEKRMIKSKEWWNNNNPNTTGAKKKNM